MRLKDSSMTIRRLTQTASLLFLHSSRGFDIKWLCNPVLSCHSCVLSWFACPIGVFVHYSGYHLFPLFAFGTVLLVGALFGRLLCGWICPFGFLQDILYKIPGKKFSLPGWTEMIKYPVLIVTVLLIPFLLGEETAYSFCRFCPASAIQVTIPNVIAAGFTEIPHPTIIKLGILASILIMVVFSSRAFCKVLCPIGALLAPLNLLSFWTIGMSAEACVSCSKCDRSCPTAVKPSSRISQGIPPNRSFDCVVCHDCQNVCPTKK